MTRKKRLNTPIDHKVEWVDGVFNDEEFVELIKLMKSLPDDEFIGGTHKSEYIREIIKRKFDINDADINIYILKQIIYIDNYYSKSRLILNLKDGKFAIEFKIDARLKDIVGAYKQFDAIRSTMFPIYSVRETKIENIRLVRSVAKARLEFKPSEIFDKLEEKALNGYEGVDNPFDVIKELNDFIYRHGINK